MGSGGKKKQTVGYKYYVGMHMVLCNAADKLIRIKVDDREAWIGGSTGGSITINKPELFGGEKREGGISGTIDFERGLPSQGPNDYLQSRIGHSIPAFRGVVGVVLRHVFIGLNPYLKRWSFQLQRILSKQDGSTQWAPSLASVGQRSFGQNTSLYFALDVSGSMAGSRLSNMKSAMSSVFDIIRGAIESGVSDLSLRVVAWSTSSSQITFHNCTPANIETARNWVNALTADGSTNFDVGISPALSFFSSATPRNNFLFFVTDGIPSGSSANNAVSMASDFLNKDSGNFNTSSGTAVHMYGINIDLTDTGQTARLDNTPEDGVPVVSGSSASGLVNAVTNGLFGSGSYADMNPAHIIRECLTDLDWGMGYQESDIDDDSFLTAAQTLKSEAMGISILWDKQTPIEDFVKDILQHIDATLYVDRTTGKFTLRLIRADYDEEFIPTLDESSIEKVENYSRPSFGELVNSVTVNYWDSESDKAASITVDDPALIQMQGCVIGTTLSFPGFSYSGIASRVAQRSLKSLSIPLLSCTIYATRQAADLNIGDVFKFVWPDYHDGYIVMRVTGLALGDGRNNKVRISCTEDAFSLPDAATVVPSPPEWEDPVSVPEPAAYRSLVEAPYFELVQRMGQTQVDTLLATNPQATYILVSAAQPTNAVNAVMMVDSGGGYEDSGTVDFCPHGTLLDAITKTSTVVQLTGTNSIDTLRIGTHAQIGSELVRIDAISGDTVTIGRGILDTIPQEHAAGTLFLAWDEYAESDNTEYVSGETISVKLLPANGSGVVALADAPADSVTLVGRAGRPYRPGNLRVNGHLEPGTMALAWPLQVTWAHRNRLQETGASYLDWYAGSVTPEPGISYAVKVYALDATQAELGVALTYNTSGETLSIPIEDMSASPLADSPFFKIGVKTVRGSIESLVEPTVVIRGLLLPPTNLLAEAAEF